MLLYPNMVLIEAIARGWNQTRDYDGDGNQLPAGTTRQHKARDIYLPPDSPLYLPFDGVSEGWTTSNSGGDETMGLVLGVRDAQGRLWRFIHLAVASAQKQLQKGVKISEGTYIGRTSAREYLGQRSKSHLHLDLFPAGTLDKDRRIDPLPVLGVTGFNVLVSGSRTGLSPQLVAGAKIVGLCLLGAGAIGGMIYLGRRAAASATAPLPAMAGARRRRLRPA